MNQQKICFITCVNDEILYQESLYYIQHLKVPDHFTVETLPVRNAPCITKAYHDAMQDSDAKYKVYLHQDVFIINQNFILDLIQLFQDDEKIGMIGMVGAQRLPNNACWWEAQHRYGSIYDSHKGYMDKDSFDAFEMSCIDVQAVDGILLITQYDLPWRKDLFDGWHFYDISQSREFINAGYRVVVPRQRAPWCVHDCGITPMGLVYEKYRRIFVQEYFRNIKGC